MAAAALTAASSVMRPSGGSGRVSNKPTPIREKVANGVVVTVGFLLPWLPRAGRAGVGSRSDLARQVFSARIPRWTELGNRL
jgi:hypothetical protein